MGSTHLADVLVESEERFYAIGERERFWNLDGSESAEADVVLVLGGGCYHSNNDVLGFALSHAGNRILTGLELVRRGKAKSLVLGGYLPFPATTARVTDPGAQQWIAQLLGHRQRFQIITNLGICLDTHDEACRFKSLQVSMGWRKVILVTSALHMRRAEKVFKKQGVDVVPFACDFQVCGALRSELQSRSWVPRKERFELLSLYMHEKVGWLYYRIRRWI